MNKLYPVKLSLLMSLIMTSSAFAEHVHLDTISVKGSAAEQTPYMLPEYQPSTPDAGEYVKKLPGANINSNGPLTSVVQYRGLFGDRVNVLINGVDIVPAGPNRMDTPLSYITNSHLDSITLYRGIAPVSSGMETIGGTLKADPKRAEFTNSDQAEIHGELNAHYADNGNMRNAGLLTSIANQNHRFQITGTTGSGDDLEFDGGDITPTEHERDTFGVSYGFKLNQTQFDLDVDHHDTGHTGTPALPMDIIWARGETVRSSIDHTLSNGHALHAQIHYQDAGHLMDNHTLRTPGMMQRENLTDVISQGIELSYQMANWQFGLNADTAEHNARISDPNNAMFYVDNFNDIQRDRLSAFAEWTTNLSDDLKIQTGGRFTRVKMDADEVDTSMAAMMSMMGMNARTLRDNFNNADRSQSDSLADIAATLTKTLSPEVDLIVGLARKERAPSYQERYLWLPLEATSGLADGKNYIGNPDLDPETAYQFELGLDWHASRFGLSPRAFYHHINDYIQGVSTDNMAAIMMSNMMNPSAGAPLEFSNVDAKLYGFDANWYYNLNSQWQLDGTVSYVRGKRRDTDDNLYRLAPLTARTTLSYLINNWQLGLEFVAVGKQNQVSSENDEQKTSGYALYNLLASYEATETLKVHAGINNLFDRGYQDHLAGYNRVSDNPDIAKGERLYGTGRSLFAGLSYAF